MAQNFGELFYPVSLSPQRSTGFQPVLFYFEFLLQRTFADSAANGEEFQ